MLQVLIVSVILGAIIGIAFVIRTLNRLKAAYRQYKYTQHSDESIEFLKLGHSNSDPTLHSSGDRGELTINEPLADIDSDVDSITTSANVSPNNFNMPIKPNHPNNEWNREKYLKPTSTESQSLRRQNPKSFKVLQTMRDWVVRDFIEYWYKPFVTSIEEEFLYRIKLALDGVFHILIKRVCLMNWNLFLMHRLLLPLEDLLLKYKQVLDHLLETNPAFANMDPIEQDAEIAKELDQSYQFHHGCKSERDQIAFLRQWSDGILQEVLEDRNYQCYALRFLCRDLLCNCVVNPNVGFLEPYYINCSIVSALKPLLEKAEAKKKEEEKKQPNGGLPTSPMAGGMGNGMGFGAGDELNVSAPMAYDSNNPTLMNGNHIPPSISTNDKELTGETATENDLQPKNPHHDESTPVPELNKMRSASEISQIASVGSPPLSTKAETHLMKLSRHLKFNLHIHDKNQLRAFLKWGLERQHHSSTLTRSNRNKIVKKRRNSVDECLIMHYGTISPKMYALKIQYGNTTQRLNSSQTKPVEWNSLREEAMRTNPVGGGVILKPKKLWEKFSRKEKTEAENEDKKEEEMWFGVDETAPRFACESCDALSQTIVIPQNTKFRLKWIGRRSLRLYGRYLYKSGYTSRMREFDTEEYNTHEWLYVWMDQSREEGSLYFQMGVVVDHLFVPINTPLIHLAFGDGSNGHPKHHTKTTSLLGRILGRKPSLSDEEPSKKKPEKPPPESSSIQKQVNLLSKIEKVPNSLLNPFRKTGEKFHHFEKDIKLIRGTMEEMANHQFTHDCKIVIVQAFTSCDPRPFYAYQLRISDNNMGVPAAGKEPSTKNLEWTMTTRYSKLREFHQALRNDKQLKENKQLVLPNFPKKEVFGDTMSPEFVAKRGKQLQKYLDTLCMTKCIVESHLFRELLIPPEIVQKYEIREIPSEEVEAKTKGKDAIISDGELDTKELEDESIEGTHKDEVSSVDIDVDKAIHGSSASLDMNLGHYEEGLHLPPEHEQGNDDDDSETDSNISTTDTEDVADNVQKITPIPGEDAESQPSGLSLLLSKQPGNDGSYNDKDDIKVMINKKKEKVNKRKREKPVRRKLKSKRQRLRPRRYSFCNKTIDSKLINEELKEEEEEEFIWMSDPIEKDEVLMAPVMPLCSFLGLSSSLSRLIGQSKNNGSLPLISSPVPTDAMNNEKENPEEKKIPSEDLKDNAAEIEIRNSLLWKEYAQLTEELIHMLEIFLNLKERSWAGNSVQTVANFLVRWFFDGYITKMIHQQMSSLGRDDSMASVLEWILSCVWPNGELFKPQTQPVPLQEKLRVREEARTLMGSLPELLPDNRVWVVGRLHIRECCLRLFGFLQQEKVMKHLMFGALYHLDRELFPFDISKKYQERMRFKPPPPSTQLLPQSVPQTASQILPVRENNPPPPPSTTRSNTLATIALVSGLVAPELSRDRHRSMPGRLTRRSATMKNVHEYERARGDIYPDHNSTTDHLPKKNT